MSSYIEGTIIVHRGSYFEGEVETVNVSTCQHFLTKKVRTSNHLFFVENHRFCK